MAGLVVTIAQRKGGAGKTTLAAQLAVAWARQGARVAALDIDPQASLAAWVDLRRVRLGRPRLASSLQHSPDGARRSGSRIRRVSQMSS
jgi:chromosome partitioning protein